MMERQTLQMIKKQLKTGTPPSISQTMQLLHSLTDHGLEALDELEGGKTVQEHRAELQERERQIRLALKDLREILTLSPRSPRPRVDVQKALFTLDMVEQMLKATGTKWRREWAWYQPRIEEEFDG